MLQFFKKQKKIRVVGEGYLSLKGYKRFSADGAARAKSKLVVFENSTSQQRKYTQIIFKSCWNQIFRGSWVSCIKGTVSSLEKWYSSHLLLKWIALHQMRLCGQNMVNMAICNLTQFWWKPRSCATQWIHLYTYEKEIKIRSTKGFIKKIKIKDLCRE